MSYGPGAVEVFMEMGGDEMGSKGLVFRLNHTVKMSDCSRIPQGRGEAREEAASTVAVAGCRSHPRD